MGQGWIWTGSALGARREDGRSSPGEVPERVHPTTKDDAARMHDMTKWAISNLVVHTYKAQLIFEVNPNVSSCSG